MRKVDPQIVVTMSPDDYMSDHEITANLLWDACFNASTPNYETGETNAARATKRIPYLYYSDSIESVDRLGKRPSLDFCLDITSVIEIKEKMLAKHESQRNQLKIQHGLDEYLLSMRRWNQERGKEINVEFAEAFRQYRAHSFPKENILEELVPVVISVKDT